MQLRKCCNPMTARVKICGLKTRATIDAAIAGGADFIGIVFYEPSPRYVTPDAARTLVSSIPDHVKTIALVVDADDDLLDDIIAAADPDMIQAHGHETPDRIKQIKARYDRPVIKAIQIERAEDFDRTRDYEGIADYFLFDAKAPETLKGALPGGNGLAFDWGLIAARKPEGDFILSGGLDPDNVAAAVALTGAPIVDVSSGVETDAGIKSETLIKRFLANAKNGSGT